MNSRPGDTDDPSDRAASARPGLGSRRIVWSAFAASVLLHLFAIFVYPYLFERLGPTGPLFLPPTTASEQGVQVIQLLDIDPTPEPEQPDEPEEIEELEQPTEEAAAPVIPGLPGIGLVPLGPSLAERLRPRFADARLWRVLPDEFFELTLEQREELVLAGRLTAWLDSAAIAQAAEDALTDWTYTDSDGGRWGISPGKIHLGDITLPLPVNFAAPVGKRDETAQLVWQWEEIMRQAARAEVEMSWRERAEAIRARRDAERVVEPPDTTRRR